MPGREASSGCNSSGMAMIKRCALALLLILALPLFGDAPPRNWGRCPAVVALETTAVVHVLGDIHGDYDRS